MSHPFMKFAPETIRSGQPSFRQKLAWSVLAILLALPFADRAFSQTTPRSYTPITITDPLPNFSTLQQEIEKELCFEKRSLVDWAAELLKKEPKTFREALVKIDILLRANLNDEAAKTAGQITKLLPDSKDSQKSSKAKESIKRLAQACSQSYRAPEVSMTIVEMFPDQMDSNMRGTLSQIVYLLREKGWEEEKIDKWIVQLQKKATKDRNLMTDIPPYYVTNHYQMSNRWQIRHDERPGTLWIAIRLENRRDPASKAEFLEQLEEEAKKNPTDILKIADCIWTWRQIPGHLRSSLSDLDWIAETAKPKTSFEAGYLGKMLAEAQQWDTARKMLQKSMDLQEKPSNEKTKRPPQMRLYMRTGSDESFKSQIQRLIKQCDAQLGTSSNSQGPVRIPLSQNQLTSSSTACSTALPPMPTPPEAPVAPKLTEKQKQRQNAEMKLIEQEDSSKNDPRYWLRRGNFYVEVPYAEMTENEVQNAEKAFQKGLELTGSKASDTNPRQPSELRRQLLRSYTNLLRNANRHEKAIELLLEELRNAKDSSIASMLTQHLQQYPEALANLKPDEPIIWDWLAKRKTWEYQEQALLDIMARRAKEYVDEVLPFTPENEAPEVIYEFVKRIEKMTKEGDPSRMEYCTKVLMGHSSLGINPNPERLIPLLKEKFESKDISENHRMSFARNLFQAYINSGYCKEAETLLKEPKYHLCDRYAFQQIARAAAKKGDKEIAMLNWRRSANYALADSSQISLNQTFRQYGLKDEIDKYYEEIRKKLPTFEAP